MSSVNEWKKRLVRSRKGAAEGNPAVPKRSGEATFELAVYRQGGRLIHMVVFVAFELEHNDCQHDYHKKQ